MSHDDSSLDMPGFNDLDPSVAMRTNNNLSRDSAEEEDVTKNETDQEEGHDSEDGSESPDQKQPTVSESQPHDESKVVETTEQEAQMEGPLEGKSSSSTMPITINDNLEISTPDQPRKTKELSSAQVDKIFQILPEKTGSHSAEAEGDVAQQEDTYNLEPESGETSEAAAPVEFKEPDHSEVNENDSESSDGIESSDEDESEGEEQQGGDSSEEDSDQEDGNGEQHEEDRERRQSRASIPPNVESIEIAAEASSIPDAAFENCQQLKFVTFPPDSQVQSIGEGAFFKCESLMEMHFPQHLEVIAHEAFVGCVELRKIHFTGPETLQRIERYAFYGCKQLLEIGNLPEDFDRIGRNAFYGCFKAQGYPKQADPKIFMYTGEDDGEVDVPEDVTHVKIGDFCEVIPKKTFMYRHQLIQVDFRNANNLKTIEKHAFYRCDNLRDVNLSSTPLHSIGQKAFFGCKSLISICPPKSLTLVDGDALNFSGYYFYRGDVDEMVPADMKQVRVGTNVNSLPKEAFVQCEKLQEVVLTDALRLTSIGEEAFYYSESLAEISLPTNVRIVERAAFLGCSSLANVSLNPNLEIIGEEAFEACTSLRMIALTENVQVIGDSAFYACDKLKTVRVNNLLKVIGQEAFMLCKSLENITLPSGLISLGENAFDQCSNLEWIDLSGPDNLPLAMHIRMKYEDEAGDRLKMASLMELYSKTPIHSSKLISNSEEELLLLEEIKAAYLLIELDGIAKVPNRAKDNGFVQFLSHHVDDQSAESLVDFLQAASVETVRRLANAKDYSGNSALQVARQPVLQAFRERLMFLGRYDLQEDAVVRKSDNSIVVEALDYKMEELYEEGFDRWSLAETLDDELFCRALEDLLLIPLENSFAVSKEYFQQVDHKNKGEISKESFLSFCTEQFGRKVVLKFMCHEDQYQRELERNSLNLDRRYILSMLRHHDRGNTPGMEEALSGFIGAQLSDGESPSEYCHLIVLPRGDRDLETIYRYEKSDEEMKSLLREVGKALSHLHDHGLVHGNLRMSKIIRQNGHLKLSDMTASALIGSEPLGLKVSTGVLPPEMIHAIHNKSGCEQFEEYYQNANSKTKASRAPKISTMPTKLWCVPRAYLTKKKGKGDSFAPRTEGLPYEVLQASVSADIWSFGALVYACCTGHSLFKVTYHDSIEDGNSLRVLWDWNDLDLSSSLEDVEENATKDLLRSLLQREESMRPSMKEVLRHPFFDPDIKMQDWQSTSTAPSGNYDYVTVLNDELETPQIRNKRVVSSSRLKNVPNVSSMESEEETVSLLEYNQLSQEVEKLKTELQKSMVSSSRSEEDSVTLSEYKKLVEEVELLKDELKQSRQEIGSHQGLNGSPNHIAFHDIKVACEGWLQKRRHDKRSLWKNRYFVSYEDGTVTYFQNAFELNDPTKGGCAFHLARFRKRDNESLDTFELQTLQGQPIMQLRLSPLTISTVDDWLGAKQHEDNSVVHKGWLQKQSRKHKQLWNDRYFLLNKTGSVIYYASAADANNPSSGGATFARVKWEHVADTTKKEDFDLKTMNGELIMKLRLSKLSSSSIDDWMKGNEWFEKLKQSPSPTSDDNFVNNFELVTGSAAPDAIVYEMEAATFSGISEMGHTYDEVRLTGNIVVPQEDVGAMKAIREKEVDRPSEEEVVNEISDEYSEDLEEEFIELNDVKLGGEVSDEIGDALRNEEEYEINENPKEVKVPKDGCIEIDDGGTEKPNENEQVRDKVSGADAIRENQDLKEEEKGIEGETNNGRTIQERQEKDDSQTDGDVTKGNDGFVAVAEGETKDTSEAAPDDERIASESYGDDILPMKEDKPTEREPNDNITADPDVQEKDGSPSGRDTAVGNVGVVQTTQEETNGADVIHEPSDDREIASGISQAFQLFKKKVMKERQEEADNIKQRDNKVSTVDGDPNASYDYSDGASPTKTRPSRPSLTVNFAGELSNRSDLDYDESSPRAIKPKPEKPTEKSKARKLGDKIPKLVSQFKDKLQLDGKARRRKRREEMKRKKRLSMQGYDSSASEGVLDKKSM